MMLQILINIGLGNGHDLSIWHEAIIWTNEDLVLIGALGKTSVEVEKIFSVKKMHLKIGLSVLRRGPSYSCIISTPTTKY